MSRFSEAGRVSDVLPISQLRRGDAGGWGRSGHTPGEDCETPGLFQAADRQRINRNVFRITNSGSPRE
jgi:hypothetical protein